VPTTSAHTGWPAELSWGEEKLALDIRATGLPAPVREHRFHPVREWLFDFAWPSEHLAVEVEGGTQGVIVNGKRVAGRHTRAAGYEEDCRKYSEAAILGWCVIRVTTAMVKSGQAIDLITRALQPKGPSEGQD